MAIFVFFILGQFGTKNVILSKLRTAYNKQFIFHQQISCVDCKRKSYFLSRSTTLRIIFKNILLHLHSLELSYPHFHLHPLWMVSSKLDTPQLIGFPLGDSLKASLSHFWYWTPGVWFYFSSSGASIQYVPKHSPVPNQSNSSSWHYHSHLHIKTLQLHLFSWSRVWKR